MIRSIFILLFLIAGANTAHAAQSAAMPYCEIIGKIIKIEERKAPYEDEKWAEDWGLPKDRTYTDVTVLVESKKPFSFQEHSVQVETIQKTCALDEPKEEVFQNNDPNLSKDWVGLKIWATTHISGDEFRFGNWLERVMNVTNLQNSGEK